MIEEIIKEEVAATEEVIAVQPFEVEVMFTFVLSMAQSLNNFKSSLDTLKTFLTDKKFEEFKTIESKLLYEKLLETNESTQECLKILSN